MKVVVLGATGHIGNAIVREMLSRGYQVTATSRRKRRPANLAGLQVRFFPGDQDAPGQLDAWVRGHDIVVDAAAPYPLHVVPSDFRESAEYAILRTRNLLEAVKRYNSLLVYVSSFTTLKRWHNRMDEWPRQLLTRLHPYFVVKEDIESDLVRAADYGIRAVIVNPTMCLGPWDLHQRDQCVIPRLLCGEIAASTNHMLNVIDVRDVAKSAVEMLQAEHYGSPTLLSGHNISVANLFSWIAEIGGVPPPRLAMSAGVGAFTGYWAELMLRVPGMKTPVALAPTLIYQHEWMPPCEALRELGVTNHPLSETLLDSIEWYRRIGYC